MSEPTAITTVDGDEKRDIHKIINFPIRYARTTGDNSLFKDRYERKQKKGEG